MRNYEFREILSTLHQALCAEDGLSEAATLGAAQALLELGFESVREVVDEAKQQLLVRLAKHHSYFETRSPPVMLILNKTYFRLMYGRADLPAGSGYGGSRKWWDDTGLRLQVCDTMMSVGVDMDNDSPEFRMLSSESLAAQIPNYAKKT